MGGTAFHANVVPVEHVFAQRGVRMGGRRVTASGVLKPLRGGEREGEERGTRIAHVSGPPADLDLLGVPELRVMKPSEGGVKPVGPENRLTARSNKPHHTLTGLERPRYGARRAARTRAAWVTAAKYGAT